MQRVMVIGNGGGGKTTLSYAIAQMYRLPLFEIDAIQFQPDWQRTADAVLRQQIAAIHQQHQWLIDGFGPWDQIEERAALADTIVFVDHPIWVHFWWACERQIAAALGQQRLGGPQDCDLRDVTRLMFETIWRVHEELRPKLLALVEQYQASKRVIWIRSPDELDAFVATLGTSASPLQINPPRAS